MRTVDFSSSISFGTGYRSAWQSKTRKSLPRHRRGDVSCHRPEGSDRVRLSERHGAFHRLEPLFPLRQPEIVQAAVADDVCLYFRVPLRLLANIHAAISLFN